MPPPGKVRPIQRFAEAVSQCGPQTAAYGQCILRDYKNVTKDKCVDDFMRLKDCYLKAAKRKS